MAPPNVEVPTSLRLSRMVRNYHKLTPQVPRSYGWHPSSISSPEFCPVKAWFEEEAHDQLTSSDPETIQKGWEFKKALLTSNKFDTKGTLQPELDVGNSIHDMGQFYLGVIGKLRGRWQCGFRGCAAITQTVDFMPRTAYPDLHGQPLLMPAPCGICNGLNRGAQYPWLYVEPGIGWTALAKQMGVVGHMDGDLWELRDGHWFRYVLEIKSINEYGWTEGKNPYWADLAVAEGWTAPEGWRKPLPSVWKKLPQARHVTQATLYAAANGITHIVFLYINKNQVNQWKEFIAPIDPSALALAHGRIQAVEGARTQKLGPPVHARICSDIRDKTATGCPAAERCFGCKAPEGAFTW